MTTSCTALLISLFSLSCVFANAQSKTVHDVVPRPVEVLHNHGKAFQYSAATVIEYDPRLEAQAQYLQEQLAQQTGFRHHLKKQTGKGADGSRRILLQLKKYTGWKPEGYELDAGVLVVGLKAGDVKGIVNGIQTLLQLLPIQPITAPSEVQMVTIRDYPRFAYRGMHLDVVRHFFPVPYIKKYIDYLTFHKFNTFHWHLTDDQGWRIEMLGYPKLNSTGSYRDSTLIGHFKDTPVRYDGKRYGGFYTRKEVKEIIDYATVRGITIIPEIDIPGHSRATIAAYPELSTRPDTVWKVATTWGMYNRQNNVLAPRPETFTFLRTVFYEIADLFPGTYIHAGGDECSKMWWKADAFTQNFIREKKLGDEKGLQAYFIDQVAVYLKEKNKKLIGWHEIMEGGPDTGSLVMNWANDAKTLEALKKGYRVIATPGKPYYFDHYQSETKKDSLAIHGFNSAKAVYEYDPVPKNTPEKLVHRILGGQGNVWTEYMEWPTKVDYMVFPRMTALSEALWTQPGKKDYNDFQKRLQQSMIPRYQLWGGHYFNQ
jgi:hexosaminidase